MSFYFAIIIEDGHTISKIIIDCIFLSIIFYYEVITIYILGWKYFTSKNGLDMSIVLLALFTYFFVISDIESEFVQYLKVITLLIMYYRLILFMAIVKYLSSVVKILEEMVKVLIPLGILSMISAVFLFLVNYIV